MLPPIRIVENTSGNANNNPMGIEIEAKAAPFGAILCQEHYEWWVKTWFFLAGFLPVLLFKFGPVNRWLEFRGHAIECAVAVQYYDHHPEAYIGFEANGMKNGYSGLFSGYSLEAIIEKLTKLQPWAEKWMDARPRLIEKYIAMDPKVDQAV
jgi:hypothetical protein